MYMSVRTPVNEREALQRLIENYIDNRYLQVSVCRSQEWSVAFP